MINLPNIEEVLSQSQLPPPSSTRNLNLFDKQNDMGRTVSQKEPTSVKVIKFKFVEDGTLVLLCLYRKSMIGLVMSKGINGANKENVDVVFE